MDKSIKSVSDLLNAIETSELTKKEHAHVRVWFRGQGNQTWKLEPGVYRPNFAKDEADRQRRERHLSQDFLTLSVPLRDFRSEAEAYFVQQHYRMPTRLLDWSLNPLAAAFFALEPLEQEGCIFVLDAYHFQPPDRGLCTPGSAEVRGAMAAIFSWTDAWPDNILAVRPTQVDPRIGAQRGCFTFHPPTSPVLTSENNPTLTKWIIPSGDTKNRLRRELELLGVDEFTIFGDLDHLAERLKRAYR